MNTNSLKEAKMVFENFFHVKIPLIKYQPCARLGLAIAQVIGEAHRGLIWAESLGPGPEFISVFILLKG